MASSILETETAFPLVSLGHYMQYYNINYKKNGWNEEERDNCKQTTKGENNGGKDKDSSEMTLYMKTSLRASQSTVLIFNAFAIKL